MHKCQFCIVLNLPKSNDLHVLVDLASADEPQAMGESRGLTKSGQNAVCLTPHLNNYLANGGVDYPKSCTVDDDYDKYH